MRQPGNEKIAEVFDKEARRYDRQMGLFERFVLGSAREWAIAQARGRVVEIAVGTGLNLPLYPADIERVVGVDLSEEMLALARRRVDEQRLDRVELHHGDVQALDLPDASADTVVSTFTYCTIPDPLRASEEAYRILTPGGRFVLAEHGPSTNAIARTFMRAAEPLSVLFQADHLMRDPVPYLQVAGFTIDEVHRSGRGGIVFRVLAHKPTGGR
jgi:ubiquinone/menaquinone biosynthesis C-methylase UbiE